MRQGRPDRVPLVASRMWLTAVLTTVAVLVSVLLGVAALSDRQATLDAGWRQVEATALVLQEQADSTLLAAEAVTQRVADLVRRRGLDALRDGGAWPELAAAAVGAAQVGAVSVLDPEGRLVATSTARRAPPMSLAGRSDIVALRDGNAFSTVSELLREPDSGLWRFHYSRAILEGEGLVGIVQVSLDAGRFERFFGHLDLPPGARISLYRSDGTLLMRWPMPALGTAQALSLAPPELQAGRFEAEGEGGEWLMGARRASPRLPIVASAALPQDAVMAPFWGRLRRIGTVFVTGGLLIGALSAAALSAARRERAAAALEHAAREGLARALAERERLLASLRDSEARLRLAQEAGGIGFWDWDLRTGAAVGSEGYTRLYGLPPGALPPGFSEWLARVHPEDRVRAEAEARAGIASGRYATEHRIVRPDGEVRWVSAQGVVLRDAPAAAAAATAAHAGDDGGGKTAHLIGVVSDVTDRRRAAEALAQANAELERRVDERTRALAEAHARIAESEARFRGIFDAAFQFIGLLAPDGTLLEANRTALEFGGLDRAEVVGRPFWEAGWWGDAEAPARAQLRAAIARAATGEFVRFETEMHGVGGQRIAVDFSLKPVVAEDDGSVALLVPEARDISALKAAQAQLHEAQKLEMLGQLTGGVAHDFNNLLMVVLGNLRLARKRLGEDADARLLRNLDGAIQGAERGAILTQRLLAFARRQDLQPCAVDVAALVGGMMDLLRRSVGPMVQISVVTEPGLRPALVDPNQLELALLNLAVNARDAMADGGRLTIALSAEAVGEAGAEAAAPGGRPPPPGEYLRICVSDTGHGMDEATLRRAVEPFFSTKGPGRGTGLGLSMVHGLAAQSGGALRLESRPGTGTTAVLWLPVASVEAAAPSGGPTRARAEPAPPGVGAVLVVDDEPLTLASAADMLADLGYEVATAASGAEALALLRARGGGDAGFGCVLTDYAMPGMTGAALARAVAAEWPGLPVVLATGYMDLPEPAASGLPRLGKPFTQEQLAARIAEAMRASAAHTRRPSPDGTPRGGAVQDAPDPDVPGPPPAAAADATAAEVVRLADIRARN